MTKFDPTPSTHIKILSDVDQNVTRRDNYFFYPQRCCHNTGNTRFCVYISSFKKINAPGSWFCNLDFFVGIELSLGAISAAIISTMDLIRTLTPKPDTAEISNTDENSISTLDAVQTAVTVDSAFVSSAILSLLFLIVSSGLFMLLVAWKRDYDNGPVTKKNQIIMLGVASNLIGVALLIGGVLIHV